MERRYLRKSAPGVSESGALNGRAIAYDQWTMIGKAPWGFREKVNPKAINKTVNDGDMVLLDNHDSGRPLARQSAGTLVLRNGDGLDWDANPPDTTYAQDVIKNARAGNYGGCSFGFEVVRDKWTTGDDGVEEREILEAKVHEISVCTFPAYDQTSVSARDQVDAAKEARKRAEGKTDAPPVTVSGTDYTDMASVLVSMYNALPEDQRSAFLAGIDTRAAKATYADLETCGDCGSTNEYGAFCSNCGESMRQASSTAGNYCTSCGASADDGQRSAHKDHIERSEPVTATRDDERRKMRLRMVEADFVKEVAE